jgi:PAS domain S-box-containing protein
VIEIRGKPLPGGGFITTYTDITSRKHAERRLKDAYDELEHRVAERTHDLRESEARFRDLAELGSDWIWQTDAELRFSYVSDRFFEVSGIPPDQVLGRRRKDMADFDNDERNQLKWHKHQADMEARRPFRRFEYALPCADGKVIQVRLAGKPFYNEAGQFLGYRGTGTDITELMMAQDELLHSEKLAALGGLVAGVAHEINTPVGIGLTAASYLEEKTQKFSATYKEGKVKRSDIEGFIDISLEASASLTTNLKRAADLVRSFKQVAVDQSSEMKRSFLLKPYINEILLSLHPKIKRTQHIIDVTGSDEIQLDSYPGAFSQILTNLIMNSLIHGFEHKTLGHINIDVSQRNNELILRYSDDGKGMSPEQIKRIFEPFYTTKRGQGGSGLGMHVVYNLVTQTLRGRIELASTLDNGVVFTLRIPTSKEMNNEQPAS